MPNPSYALWSIWNKLPFLHQLFFLFLFVVSGYTVFSAAKVLARVRSLMASGGANDLAARKDEVAALSFRCANVRHLITGSFYLFGIVFLWGLRFALWTPDSRISVAILVLQNFFLYFAFAANAFLVFLILHSVQWFASARLQACARFLIASRVG
jgi:hypothetical protein